MKYSIWLLVLASVFLCLSICINSWSGVLLAYGELAAGLAGLPIFLEIFSKIETKFSFAKILAAVTLFSTGLGTFNTYLSFDSYSAWLIFLNELYIEQNSSVAITQLYVIVYCVFLIACEYFLKATPSNQKFRRIADNSTLKLLDALSSLSNQRDTSVLLAFSALISLLQIYLVLSGRKAFRGGVYEELKPGFTQLPTDPLNIFVDSLIPVVFLLLGFLSKIFSAKGKANIYSISTYGFIVLAQILWIFVSSARSLIVIYGIILLLGCRFSIWNGFKSIPTWLRRNFPILLIVGFFLAFLIRFVYLLRFLANQDSNLARGSIFELFLTGLETFFSLGSNPELQSELERTTRENVETRTFVMSAAVSVLEQMMSGKAPFWGQEFIHNFLAALPSAVVQDKSSVLVAEELWSQNFSLYSNDIADSFYLSAIADFYWFGLVIYPAVIYFLVEFACRVALNSKSGVFVVLTASILLYTCLSGGEGNFIGFLVGIRNILIVIPLLLAVRFILPTKLAARIYVEIA